MILRRITQHVKDQNWFAVGLDFIIVVAGVVIGIQVANWNEDRQQHVDEAEIIERVADVFARIKLDAERSRKFHRQITSDLTIVVKSLRSDNLADSDIDAVKRALFLGTTFQTSADRSGTTRELLSSGQANLLRDKGLLEELVAYEAFLDRHDQAMDFFLRTATELTVPFTKAFELDIESAFFDETLYATNISPPIGALNFEAMAADDDFENAAEELLFVQNVALMWRLRIDAQVENIQEQLAEKK